MNKDKTVLPITILLASIILGGFYYASQVNKQRSIEKQQQIELQAKIEAEQVKAEQSRAVLQAKTEQNKREYIAKRKIECYDIGQKERENWNNINGSTYNEDRDTCIIVYTTDEYEGVNCNEEYKDLPDLYFNCLFGTFKKEF